MAQEPSTSNDGPPDNISNVQAISTDCVRVENSGTYDYLKDRLAGDSSLSSPEISPGRKPLVSVIQNRENLLSKAQIMANLSPLAYLPNDKETDSIASTSSLSKKSDQREEHEEEAFGCLAGLKFIQFFFSGQISLKLKISILLTTWTFLVSLAMNSAELYVYTNSLCTEDPGFGFCVYLNFTGMIFMKLYSLSTINKQLMANSNQNSNGSLLIPFSYGGFITLLQFPQMTYDYETCEERSPIFSRTYVIRFSLFFGAAFLAAFAWKVLKLTFYLCESELLSRKYPKFGPIKYGIYITVTLLAYAQTVLIGLTQTTWWVANLFIEYTLIVMLGVFTGHFTLKARRAKKLAQKLKSPEVSLRIEDSSFS